VAKEVRWAKHLSEVRFIFEDFQGGADTLNVFRIKAQGEVCCDGTKTSPDMDQRHKTSSDRAFEQTGLHIIYQQKVYDKDYALVFDRIAPVSPREDAGGNIVQRSYVSARDPRKTH